MNKFNCKTTNWKQCNQALINRNLLTFWTDKEAIQLLAMNSIRLKVYDEGE
ncbi:hypothetical protein BTN50_1306 [Candidatus Enterovibrio altilux]|uniref:Mobile element protein n=1 Tax=Candidatus Enterovibrio altilux TaxID=1927128 RepID=A0A291B9T3_9GAMM|nr:hypothetical protein BTN50_1306 [Candidatus Enterovibrio luxaltus]